MTSHSPSQCHANRLTTQHISMIKNRLMVMMIAIAVVVVEAETGQQDTCQIAGIKI